MLGGGVKAGAWKDEEGLSAAFYWACRHATALRRRRLMALPPPPLAVAQAGGGGGEIRVQPRRRALGVGGRRGDGRRDEVAGALGARGHGRRGADCRRGGRRAGARTA